MTSLRLLVCLIVFGARPALALDGGSMRAELSGRTLACADDQFSVLLTFDQTATLVKRRYGQRPPQTLRVSWMGGRAEIPLEDLAEPGVIERRGKQFRYEGLPCRIRE